MTPEEIERAMSHKRTADEANQKNLRIALWGLMLTVASMLMGRTWLISEINSKTDFNGGNIQEVVTALGKTNDKLDNVSTKLSNIEGRLAPITLSNQKQAEFSGFMELFVSAMGKKASPTQSVSVGR